MNASVVMRFDDGEKLSTWESFELRDTFTDPLGAFKFVARPRKDQIPFHNAHLKKGERVRVEINGNPQATMLIMTVDRTVDMNGISYAVDCKTLLATPYEGSVDPEISKRFTAESPAVQVVLEALSMYGFDIAVATAGAQVNALTGKAIEGRGADVIVEALKLKDADAQDGEHAVQFANRLLGRLGVAMRLRHDGTILICVPDYNQAAAYAVHEGQIAVTGSDRMIEPIEEHSTNEGAFSEIVVRGGSDDTSGKKSAGKPHVRCIIDGELVRTGVPFENLTVTTVPATRAAYASSAAPFKPLYVSDKLSTDLATATRRVERIMGRHSEETYTLGFQVAGLVSATGRVWSVDTVVHVRSETLGIDEDMWLLEVSKSMNRQAGQQTRLKLIPKGALVLGELPG